MEEPKAKNQKQSLPKVQTLGKYIIEEVLGSGGFGVVYKCTAPDKSVVAIKKFTNYTPSNKQQVQAEIETMSQINHQNVVKLIDIFYIQDNPCIVMEYCNGGTLSQQIVQQKNEIYTEEAAIAIFTELIQGLRAVHQKNIIHRDLKCSNIIFHNGIPKIADFGLAKQLKQQQNSLTRTKCGTLPYEAPEILEHRLYSFQVDIWSLGTILFKMLFHEYPFGSNSETKQLQRIKSLCVPEFQIPASLLQSNPISISMQDLFRKMFMYDYKKRINFKDLLQHPALVKYQIKLKQEIAFYNTFDKLMEISNMSDEENSAKEEQKADQAKQVDQAQINQEKEILLMSYFNYKKQKQIKGPSTEQVYTEQLVKYNQCIVTYSFLLDCYENFKEIYQNYGIIKEEMFIIQKYFMLKMICFYVKSFLVILQDKENIFEISQDWQSFANSKSYQLMIQNTQQIYLKYISEFDQVFEDIKACEIKNKDIVSTITDKIKSHPDFYKTLPDDIKLPTRAILLSSYKQYEDAATVLEADNKKYGKKTYMEELFRRNALRLLMCAVFTRIFRMEHPFIKLSEFKAQKKNLRTLLQWLYYIDKDTSKKQIENIIQSYFPDINKIKFDSFF